MPHWGGSERSLSLAGDRIGTDYDRALEYGSAYWSAMPVDTKRHAIILGGGPADATWLSSSTSAVGGILVHVQFGPPDAEVLQHVRAIPAEEFRRVNPDLTVVCPRMRLFEAAYRGTSIGGSWVPIDLTIGRFRVETAELWRESIGLVAHRLVLEAI